MEDCNADTGKNGFLVPEHARLIGCSSFNHCMYQMPDVSVIAQWDGFLLPSVCMLRKNSLYFVHALW